MTLPWSNGPTEGTVNKIKLIKRKCTGGDHLKRSVNVFCSRADMLHGINGRTAHEKQGGVCCTHHDPPHTEKCGAVTPRPGPRGGFLYDDT